MCVLRKLNRKSQRVLKLTQCFAYLKFLFSLLGRPSQSDWPVDVAIPITSFPVQSAKPVSQFVPRMNEQAADLLLVSALATPSVLFG